MFDALDDLIDQHPAVNNAFFEYFRKEPLTPQQLTLFLPDYYAWIRAFPKILAALTWNVRDNSTRFFLTQILYSELGSGDESRMHYRLFGELVKKLGVRIEESQPLPVYSETRALIDGMERLYGDNGASPHSLDRNRLSLS